MYIFFFLVSFLASLAGAICGIGGGVVMKPLLDAFNVMSVSAVSFLSGCTVLSMSAVSIGLNISHHELNINKASIVPMSAGAAAGGVIGKVIFQQIKAAAGSEGLVGFTQAAVLLFITALTFIYTVNKGRMKTYEIKNRAVCAVTGAVLGFFSSFLGIGGGPINLMVLSFLFSLSVKEAAVSSLFMILISQLASLGQTLLTGSLPSDMQAGYLILMVAGGVLGGRFGNRLQKSFSDTKVQNLFLFMMGVIICINIYNMHRFYGMI